MLKNSPNPAADSSRHHIWRVAFKRLAASADRAWTALKSNGYRMPTGVWVLLWQTSQL